MWAALGQKYQGAIFGGLNHLRHKVEVGIHVMATRKFLRNSGFSSDMVKQDVVAHGDKFFGKSFAMFKGEVADYGDFFTGGQLDSYSGTADAYVSKAHAAGGISFAAKYYPSRAHSIGLARTGPRHFIEFLFEGIDGLYRNFSGSDNVFYDMHGTNSRYYLKYAP